MVDERNQWSDALQSKVCLKVFLPEKRKAVRVMILLHGTRVVWDNFGRELALEELADFYSMVIAVPQMQDRYYIATQEYDCDRFAAQELPSLLCETYGIDDAAERCLAGVSMGGFGAVLIGARTGVFSRIISVSGSYIAHDVAIGNPEVWGELLPYSDNLKSSFLYYFLPLDDLETSIDRNALAALAILRGKKTQITATCGTKDWLYPRNLAFVKAMEDHKVNHHFYPLEGGEHESKCFQMGLWKAVQEWISESKE